MNPTRMHDVVMLLLGVLVGGGGVGWFVWYRDRMEAIHRRVTGERMQFLKRNAATYDLPPAMTVEQHTAKFARDASCCACCGSPAGEPLCKCACHRLWR